MEKEKIDEAKSEYPRTKVREIIRSNKAMFDNESLRSKLRSIFFCSLREEFKLLSVEQAPRFPRLQNKTVLVISAHADDHIACAGTLFKLIHKGYEVNEVVLTDSSEGKDFRKPGSITTTKKLRNNELSAASKFLNVKNTYKFNQEDLSLTFSKGLVFKVVPIIRQLKPTVGIIMNEFDWHNDHVTAFKIGSEAFKWAATGVKPELGSAWRTPIVLSIEGMLPIKPNILVDITNFAHKKMELWRIYESQAKPRALNFDEGLSNVRGYHLRRPGSLKAEAFVTDPTSPMILFDD